MKRILKIPLLLLLSQLQLGAAVAPYIQLRSQSVDSARELMGWTHFVNLFDQERVYGVTGLTLEYTQSFQGHAISQNLFGDALQCDSGCDNFIVISGSQFPNRNANDLLADNFGLSTDFRSKVFFNPSIRNVILDLNFYLGLDQWLCGLYFRIHAPIVHTWWDLNFCENVTHQGTFGYAPGYYNDSLEGVSIGNLVQSFEDYIVQGQVPNLGPNVLYESLRFGRMSRHAQSLTRLSDIEMAFGWNFVQRDEYHFGLNLRATAPAGNRPCGALLFEPIVGNGHHWGLGLGMTMHWLLWQNDCGHNCLGLYVDANVGTLFKTRQQRTFDLSGKPLSRYMVAELFGVPPVNLVGGTTALDAVAPSAQFQGVFRPVANLTTTSVYSSIPFQADVTLLFNYTQCNYSIDVGYNFWATGCEKLRATCCINPLNDTTLWGLKGDASVYGFVATDAAALPPGVSPDQPIALSVTQSQANINAGTNTPIGTPFDPSQMRNPNIDNPALAFVDSTDQSNQIMVAPFLPADVGPSINQQRTSIEPVLLSISDVDLDGARVDGLSHKLFVHVSYTWDRRCGWTPYLGIGGKVEVAPAQFTGCCAKVCDGCLDTNVSEWGVWAKGGFAF